MDVFYVYILQSQMNGSFYKGSTNDLLRRFHEHNAGKDRATSRYTPWNLVWFTTKPTKAEAVQLERKLKNLSIQRTIEFVKKYPVTKIIQGLTLHEIRVQP
jgi:putative endonuclease